MTAHGMSELRLNADGIPTVVFTHERDVMFRLHYWTNGLWEMQGEDDAPNGPMMTLKDWASVASITLGSSYYERAALFAHDFLAHDLLDEAGEELHKDWKHKTVIYPPEVLPEPPKVRTVQKVIDLADSVPPKPPVTKTVLVDPSKLSNTQHNVPSPRPPGLNIGHGHVYPRDDGKRARCTGTQGCDSCQADQAQLLAEARD